MTRLNQVALSIIWLAASTACDRPEESASRTGEWLGYAAIADDRLLPIRAFVDIDGGTPSGHFLVADERTDIPEIQIDDDSMRFVFAEYGAVMEGRLDNGRFAGQYTRFRDDTTSFPFVLFWNQSEPPFEKPDSSVVGTYRVVFGNGDDADDSSVAQLEIDGDRVTGTVIHPSGDYGLLEGVMTEDMLQLYRFTGWQAIYFELTESTLGFRGRFHVRGDPPQDVAFLRTEANAREVDRITRMKDPDAPFLFSGLTANGTIVTSQDSQFVGRPMVVDIMGTWCHNCLDAAPLLESTAKTFADRGLKIISLSFEVPEDAVTGIKNIEMFKERFGITYPILYCGSLDQENIAARLDSQMENFFSYPTTLFIDRNGRVTEIHTGFNGPGAGDRWDEQVAEFNAAVAKIVKD